MHSFYIDGIGTAGEQARLQSEEARHACRVLRVKPGEEFYALDGENRFLAEFVTVSDKGAEALLKELLPDNESPVRVTVYQGVAKSDKLELIAQKLTELGVYELVPVRMARSVAKLEGAARVERLGKIAHEASKQCKRAKAMTVAEPVDLKKALSRMAEHDLLLVPWEEEGARRMKDVFAAESGAKDIGIVIGPEGGIAPEEIERMESVGAKPVTLGPRILRAETAAITAAGMAMMLWGDL